MPFARPSILPRRVTEPAQTATLASAACDQTLRTLEMLGAMGYREVWARAGDADAATIALAAREGWSVGARHDGRIKFCRAAPAPVRSPSEDSYVSPSRTTSPTRLPPERGPSPYAQMRRAQAQAEVPARAASAQERRDSVTWTRGVRAESAAAALASPRMYGHTPPVTTPSVVISPPQGEAQADDYFAFVPSEVLDLIGDAPQHLADVPESPESTPSQEADEVVFAGEGSEQSVYSRDSFEELLFQFDVVDPFSSGSSSSNRTRTPSPPPVASHPFRPTTPELIIRARRGVPPSTPSTQALRPTFQLTRLTTDPGPQRPEGPSFCLEPVAAPTLRRMGAVRRSSREPVTLRETKRGSI